MSSSKFSTRGFRLQIVSKYMINDIVRLSNYIYTWTWRKPHSELQPINYCNTVSSFLNRTVIIVFSIISIWKSALPRTTGLPVSTVDYKSSRLCPHWRVNGMLLFVSATTSQSLGARTSRKLVGWRLVTPWSSWRTNQSMRSSALCADGAVVSNATDSTPIYERPANLLREQSVS